MQEHIEFNPSYSLLTLARNPGESVNVEPGAMVSMSGMSMQTGMSGGGGFGGFLKSMAKSAFGGESFFLNTYSAGPQGGWVSLAPGQPGDIQHTDIQPGRQIFIQSGSYLASTPNIKTDTKFQGAKGFFSGESLFFIRAFTEDGQPGRTWFNSYGAMKEIPIQPGQVVTIDTGHVVAFDDSVTYEIGKVGGMKSFMFGGEGIVMHFSGQGRVWIQTRNLASLASNLIPFWPTSN